MIREYKKFERVINDKIRYYERLINVPSDTEVSQLVPLPSIPRIVVFVGKILIV